MYAAWKGNLEFVQILLEHGADIRACDHEEDCFTAVEWAIYQHQFDVVAYLKKVLRATAEAKLDAAADAKLEKLEGDNLQKELNRLAVEAASECRWDRSDELLERGAEINGRGRCDRTLLMYAAFQDERKRFELLLENGANPSVKDCRGRRLSRFARTPDMKKICRGLLGV